LVIHIIKDKCQFLVVLLLMVYYNVFSHLELPQLGLSQNQMHLKVHEENATLESSMIINYGKCYSHLKDTCYTYLYILESMVEH
jgi:hypothetical protein